MFSCKLCEKETVYWNNLCEPCRKVKHYLNLYDKRVYEVLDAVLARDISKQDNKIEVEIRKEIAQKELSLKQKKKAKFHQNAEQ